MTIEERREKTEEILRDLHELQKKHDVRFTIDVDDGDVIFEIWEPGMALSHIGDIADTDLTYES